MDAEVPSRHCWCLVHLEKSDCVEQRAKLLRWEGLIRHKDDCRLLWIKKQSASFTESCRPLWCGVICYIHGDGFCTLKCIQRTNFMVGSIDILTRLSKKLRTALDQNSKMLTSKN